MKFWALFSALRGSGPFKNAVMWHLVGIFPSESAAVSVGVPMLDADPTKRFRVQRWTLGQIGPDSNGQVD